MILQQLISKYVKGDRKMKQNQYYNRHTMNLKQLTRDLEKQGFTCELFMCTLSLFLRLC